MRLVRFTLHLAPIALAAACLGGCLTQDPGSSTGSLEQAVCGQHESQFVSSHDGTVWGTLNVSNTDTDLIVEIESALPDLHILDLYLDAENGPIVHATGGYVNYFAFPYQAHFPAGGMPATYTFVIPLSQIGVTADQCASLNIAAYAVMKQLDAGGTVVGAYHGWAAGDTVCPMNYDDGCAWSAYDFCCEQPPPPPEESGCTLTQGYWKTHNQFARQKPLRIDWPAPYDENDQLCGQSLLSILQTSPQGDAWLILAHQFIAAELNIASGASTTAEVDQAMTDAAAFLDANCGGVPAADAPEATQLATTLDDYNNGFIGPGHCD